jgi:hypothetical protein
MRRYLGLSVGEALALPAWERRMLHEQMLEDQPWITNAVLREPPEDDGMGPAVSGDPDSLRDLGFNV